MMSMARQSTDLEPPSGLFPADAHLRHARFYYASPTRKRHVSSPSREVRLVRPTKARAEYGEARAEARETSTLVCWRCMAAMH